MMHRRSRSGSLKAFSTGIMSLTFVGATALTAHAETAHDMQWHLEAMQAEKMWEVSKGKGVTVAVIDTGVDSSLPDLKGQVLPGKDFTEHSGGPHDDNQGHGTGIASLIAGTGAGGSSKGTMGLAPEAEILPLRVHEGSDGAVGNLTEGREKFANSVAPAIRYAADSEAKILNISLGTYFPSAKIASALKYALSQGKIVFGAVGNAGDRSNRVMYPAGHPGVVGVGAVDQEVEATDESQSGEQVDLVAPGKDMVHSCPGGTGLCKSHGTSAAAAVASASAALIWAEHPDWTANQVTRVLVETAGGPDSGKERTDHVGYGAVRPRIALLEGPVDPGDPNTSPLPGPAYEGDATASAEPPAGSEEANASDSEDGSAAPVSEEAESGLSTGAWIGYGLLAAAILAGVIAAPVLLARRKRNQAVPSPQFAPGPPSAPDAPPGRWSHPYGNAGDHRRN
jgi:type VII secretion-associated serine protease mycosin